MNSNKRGGFTLVEILIVVVILGILAAIVIPQFTNASESAKVSSLISQLQTIRSQLELFQVQHNGKYPTLDGSEPWKVMTTQSDATEATSSTADGNGEFGPYLQAPAVNPFSGGSSVGSGTDTDWQYDSSDGTIKANVDMSDADAQALGLDTSNDVNATGG